MDNLNNIDVLTEMEAQDTTTKKDEFPFMTDMTCFWKSLVSSIESRLGELKINGKLNRTLSTNGI
jgi:hypothetical protein